MPEIRLPLSALGRADACELARRTADFAARHGHPPGDESTWAEWCAVTPSLRSRLWAVACALPLIYPVHREKLLRVVVEVGYRAARRAQPAEPNRYAVEALDLVRRWLDGESISADAAFAAARAAFAAADAARAAAFAAARAAAFAAADAAAFAAARDAAAAYAADAATNAAAARAAYAAERALQAQDLEELLAALRLEVLDG